MFLVSLAIAVTGMTAAGQLASTQPADAAVASQFQAGNIISDANFYNASAMSEAQVQAFFRSKSCSPRNAVPCLQDFVQTTWTRPAQGAGHCAQYDGAPNESAARIVWRVAQVCGISPAVLLVLMQKEQSLITNPSVYGYERAMGWGCPDTAPCNAEFFGFYNQVYKSAWQFRQYTVTAAKWRYKIGDNQVQYHPNAACGSGNVRILNQATANLYIYTPYQPNGAALANLYGTGDTCSSYGNRNFWRMYTDWFGSPTDPAGTPVGVVKELWTTPGLIRFWGWTFDPNVPRESIAVHVSVGGKWFTTTANAQNSATEQLYPGTGTNHGFGLSVPAPPGPQEICIYGINRGAGANLLLTCQTVNVPDASPQGEVKEMWGGVNSIGLWGWAADPDVQTAKVPIHIRIGSTWRVLTADQPYPGLEARFPESPQNHGFGGTVAAPPGTHEVCVFGVNSGLGANRALTCQTVTVYDGSPVGELKDVWGVPGGVSLWGWTVDTDNLQAPGVVHIRVDGTRWHVLSADQAYTPAKPVRGARSDVGFGSTIPVAAGSHEICVYGANVGAGSSTLLGCRTVTVPGGSPVGVVNEMKVVDGAFSFWGWTLDPDTADPIDVHALVDGRWAVLKADSPNAAVAAAWPGYGPNHGFGGRLAVPSGTRSICLYGINVGAGQNLTLGCWTRDVP